MQVNNDGGKVWESIGNGNFQTQGSKGNMAVGTGNYFDGSNNLAVGDGNTVVGQANFVQANNAQAGGGKTMA